MTGTLLQVGLTNALVAGLMALVLLALGGVLRKRSALMRALCLLILIKLVTPPLVPLRVPMRFLYDAPAAQSGEVDPRPATTMLGNDGALGTAASAGLETTATRPLALAARNSAPSVFDRFLSAVAGRIRALPWALWLGVVWIGGTVAYLMLTLVRFVRFRRLLRVARPIDGALAREANGLVRRLGLARSPEILTVRGRLSPLLWALSRRPKVVLPADLLERIDHDSRLALIAHELAHLRRRDHWVRVLEVAVTAIHWWNPVVWWVRGRLQEAEEECCDAWVVWAMPAAAERYASSLVTTMGFLSHTGFALPPAASGARHFESLKRRLTMIMTDSTPRKISTAGRLALVLVALAMLPFLPMAAGAPESPAPEPAPPAATPPRPEPAPEPPVARDTPPRSVPAPEPMVVPDAPPRPVPAPEPTVVPDVPPRPVPAPGPTVRPDMPRPAPAPGPTVRPDMPRPAPAPVPRPDAPRTPAAVAPGPAELPSPSQAPATAPSADPPRATSRRDGDSPAQIRAWVESELANAIDQLTHDFEHELRTSREDIRRAVRQESRQVQTVLVGLDIDSIVEELIREAPESLRLFAREVDPGGVVRDALGSVNTGSDAVSAEEQSSIMREVELELEMSLREMELGILEEVRDWRNEIRAGVYELSEEARKAVAGMDFESMTRQLTAGSPAPVRQLIREVDVPGVVAKALDSTL